jgi:hypothetical protein
MVSYRELVEIRTQMATMMGMLQATLALQGKVDQLDKRVQNIELIMATSRGENRLRNTLLAWVAGMVTAAFGGGALYYLPVLWGGQPLKPL